MSVHWLPPNTAIGAEDVMLVPVTSALLVYKTAWPALSVTLNGTPAAWPLVKAFDGVIVTVVLLAVPTMLS
jgi:hypothetical protein